jgi:hypothetical protein
MQQVHAGQLGIAGDQADGRLRTHAMLALTVTCRLLRVVGKMDACWHTSPRRK